MSEPLSVRAVLIHPHALQLGTVQGQLENVTYSWRPYEERSPEAREDYDRLKASLQADGEMHNPLIIFRNCVLIGQRRCEIARDLGWTRVPCWDIQDDITADINAGRVLALRDRYLPAPY